LEKPHKDKCLLLSKTNAVFDKDTILSTLGVGVVWWWQNLCQEL
jgi:hypothetical protein